MRQNWSRWEEEVPRRALNMGGRLQRWPGCVGTGSDGPRENESSHHAVWWANWIWLYHWLQVRWGGDTGKKLASP